MNETSRRSFIAAGAGAAAGTVVLTTDAATAAGAPAEQRAVKMTEESIVAWVPDHKADALHIMVDEREVVVHDRALVRRLLAAAGGR